MGVSPKWVKSKRRREKERLNDGNNNGQATHGAHKHAWRTQAAWACCLLGTTQLIAARRYLATRKLHPPERSTMQGGPLLRED